MADIPYQSADRLGNTINIWVYVEPGSGESKTLVAPFWVPKGVFTLVWSLVTLGLDAGAPLATFADPGIVLTLQGDEVTVIKERLSSHTQYWMAIENQAIEHALLEYEIRLGGGLGARYVYDPVIIVSKDPVDPPPDILI